MYSRYGDNSKRPIRLPEHYGGSVFSQSQQLPTEPVSVHKKESGRPFSKDGVSEKVSPVADRLLRAEAAQENAGIDDTASIASESCVSPISPVSDAPEKTTEEQDEKAPTPPVDRKTPSSLINFDGLRRLLGGKEGEGDQDRLLLLGLILLLSRTEGDSDILLWLSLLLLCG